jgi:hypothetical protein
MYINKQMNSKNMRCRGIALALIAWAGVAWTGVALAPFALASQAIAQEQRVSGTGAVVRRVGAIKAISGTTITLTPDSGADLSVTLQPNARIVRIAPGEKDLKNATPIQAQDLHVGDRILVSGKASDDNASVVASSVVVMTHTDLEAKHQQDLQDWQKRGVGGLVSAVDPAAGTVTISVVSFAGKKNIVVRSSKSTVIRRYAPDSVKFDDAKASTLQEIQPGDQVRARGEKNADGTEVAADEIVSGSFRNVAGTVNSVDASSSTISVHDLLSKKNITVKVTADSQLRHLPPEIAQRIAARLKGGASGAGTSGGAPGGDSGQSASPGQNGGGQSGTGAGSTGGTQQGSGSRSYGGSGRSGAGSGNFDLQQMLSRMPAGSLTDLHKGDAVLVVSTEGSDGTGTAIQLVSGVEPILQAAPGAGQAMMLAPWSLGGAPAGDTAGP